MNERKPVALIILDGWGIREMAHGNAVVQAQTPNYDRWLRTYERSILEASGEAVGLPAGQMGNSEVGHLNLGAGRIVYQDITRIDKSIRDGEFARTKRFNGRFPRQRKRGQGSPGGPAGAGRRPQPQPPPVRPARFVPRRRRHAHHPYHHRRPRHAAAQRAGLFAGIRSASGRTVGDYCYGERPLLHHGPGQTVAAHSGWL
jgi:hypothetical protein